MLGRNVLLWLMVWGVTAYHGIEGMVARSEDGWVVSGAPFAFFLSFIPPGTPAHGMMPHTIQSWFSPLHCIFPEALSQMLKVVFWVTLRPVKQTMRVTSHIFTYFFEKWTSLNMPSISLLFSGSGLLQIATTGRRVPPPLHALHWYNCHLYPLLHPTWYLNNNNQCPVGSYLLLCLLPYLIPRNASFFFLYVFLSRMLSPDTQKLP